MKKALFFTVLSWAIALTGYAQTMRVPMPKGLHCNDIPTWPITHGKKANPETNAGKANSQATQQAGNRPVTTLPPLPFIKFWIGSESNDSKSVE